MRKYFFLHFGNKIVSKWIILALDLIFVCFSFFLAYSLRFNFDALQIAQHPLYTYMLLIGLTYLAGFLVVKPYAGIIRHTGLVDLERIILANLLSFFIGMMAYAISFYFDVLLQFRIPLSM